MSADIALPEDWEQLVQAARNARRRAYTPYSSFAVGAAIRMHDGRRFDGCNVENASYGLTICAERVAMSTAVAAGALRPVVLCVSLAGHPSPCGSCRQFLYEFNPEMIILLDNCETDSPPRCLSLQELLPLGFRLDTDATP